MTMASFSSELALLIGLGVGVDYALFIVTRYRQALLRGKSREEAIVESLDTSGRAVLFAGMIVCIAMLGMFALGVSFLYGVAVAAAIAVAFTVLAALTLLPALLGRRSGSGAAPPRAARAARGQAARQRRVARGGRGGRTRSEAPGRVRRRRGAGHGRARDPVLLDAARLGRRRHRSRELRPRARPTTCSPRASGRATTGRSSSSREVELRSAGGVHARRGGGRAHPGRGRLDPAHDPAGRDGRPSVAIANVYPNGSPQAASTSDLLTRVRDQVVPTASRGHRPARARRWDHGDLRGLQPDPVEQAAAVHRDRRRAQLPAADGRVPQPADPAHGGGHERCSPPARRSAS